MKIVGIDPGLNGAIAILQDRRAEIFPCPVITIRPKSRKRDFLPAEMARLIPNDAALAVLEKAQAMPKQGTASTFRTGRGFGLWEGILVTKGLPYVIVHPKTWQREFLRDISGDNPKTKSIIAAKRLFPGISLRRNENSRKDDSGFADALLLAAYGHRIFVPKFNKGGIYHGFPI